jgi:hypothetical protein
MNGRSFQGRGQGWINGQKFYEKARTLWQQDQERKCGDLMLLIILTITLGTVTCT